MTDEPEEDRIPKRYVIDYYDPINGYAQYSLFHAELLFDTVEDAQAECESMNDGIDDAAKEIGGKFVVIDRETGEEVK